ncbi:hypothetical protein HanIR_Chr11g0539671 [Helianthus annuus]|nr:hypothetical protein HanIR_Chr11g0539671 [Helianthus annuus]
MLFFMSGRDGSIGYSFFSELELTGTTSLNFDIVGDDTNSEGEQGEPLSGDDDRVGDQELDVLTETVSLLYPTDPSDELFMRSSSREDLIPDSFGGTTITSTGR